MADLADKRSKRSFKGLDSLEGNGEPSANDSFLKAY